MKPVEAMLYVQAMSLQTMFTNLVPFYFLRLLSLVQASKNISAESVPPGLPM